MIILPHLNYWPLKIKYEQNCWILDIRLVLVSAQIKKQSHHLIDFILKVGSNLIKIKNVIRLDLSDLNKSKPIIKKDITFLCTMHCL